jgi:hypothetical protein
VRFGAASTRHRQHVRLDNTRNAQRIRFTLRVGTRVTRMWVHRGRTALVVVRLSPAHATRVRVLVRSHVIGHERVRP